MELRDYIDIIRRSLVVIIGLAVLLGVLGYWYAIRKPPQFQGIVTYTVLEKSQSEAANVYTFDNYFSVQAGYVFADTLSGFITSPTTVLEVYNRAGIPAPASDFKRLARVFRFQKASEVAASLPTYVNVPDEAGGKRIMESLTQVVNDFVRQNQDSGHIGKDFSVVASDPAVVSKVPDPEITTTIFALAGLVLGIGFAFVKEQLK